VTSTPREISYWKHPVERILQVEAVFWALLGGVALIAWRFAVPASEALPLAAGCAVLRLLLHVRLAAKAPEPGPTGVARKPADEPAGSIIIAEQ
jgi:hypothetical protein